MQTPTLDEIIDATMPKREADALRKRYWDTEYERVSMSLSRPRLTKLEQGIDVGVVKAADVVITRA